MVYEQDERGWWVASVSQVAGCHTPDLIGVRAKRTFFYWKC